MIEHRPLGPQGAKRRGQLWSTTEDHDVGIIAMPSLWTNGAAFNLTKRLYSLLEYYNTGFCKQYLAQTSLPMQPNHWQKQRAAPWECRAWKSMHLTLAKRPGAGQILGQLLGIAGISMLWSDFVQLMVMKWACSSQRWLLPRTVFLYLALGYL